MPIGLSDEFTSFDQRAVIKVCGIGGGGGNAVGRMIEAGLKDVEFITVNTDAQALKHSPAGTRLQIGVEITGGLGSGAKPEVGQKAAMEDRDRLTEVLRGSDMVFLTAGLGGGTGTGASPIVAEIARSTGALTVAIVTLPFGFEGNERMANAMKGLTALEQHVDTLIVVPNDRVATLCQNNISLLTAFRQADEVLHNGVRAISELITVPGLINLDFADVRTVMQSRGRALMGIGVADGEHRAVRAAEEAIICPLLEQSNINGAMGVIVNIKGGCDIGMREVQDAVTTVQKSAHPQANIIFGAVIDEEERPELQVTVIAAGFPKGVSEEFLSTDGSRPMPRVQESIELTSPPKPAQAAVPEPAVAAPAATANPQLEPALSTAAPAEQYLFPEEESVASAEPFSTSYTPQSDPEEDLSIPAFMRNRKRKTK
ncbi:MAG: cell division protein FtsZ [Candidatus Hydrogenedentes bacterium]|nr:cell division protein FtsZ [Candidatus Hydrogenedentota bacterium]